LLQQDIDALTWTNDAGEVKRLNQAHRKKLSSFKDWLHLAGVGSKAETLVLQITSFDMFIDAVEADVNAKIQAVQNASTATTGTVATIAAAAPSSTSTYTPDLAGNFIKGIKLDDSKFPKLENKTNFIIWKRDLKTAAKMMNVWKVLDDSYKPSTPEEVDLHERQQSWMYAAFGKSLLTLSSKRIWKKHPDDARAVYLEIKTENETALKTKFATKELEDAYKKFKWTPKYNGPLASFLERFSDKASDYNEVKKSPKLTDDELREQLETAIDECPELMKALTSVGTIERAQLGTGTTTAALSFDKFYDIIMETAVLADQSWKIHHPIVTKSIRQANHAGRGSRGGRGIRRQQQSHNTTMTATEKNQLTEIQKKYGTAATRYFVPTELFKELPPSVQQNYKDWRKAEQKKNRPPRSANVQQQVPPAASSSGDSTIRIE
jgi:hypothetical protein